ncbi:aminotransferase, partial [Pseudomonas sp. BGM005]|nr:aminotransferase [Pseudomonas sp. BG5]
TRLVEGLRAQGWDVPDSQANFVWLPTGKRTDEVAAAFVAGDLIVRPFPGDGIRISVGEEESVARVLDVASTLL